MSGVGQGREHICSVYVDVQRMVKDGRWKLIRYYRARNRPAGSERIQVFDLVADPFETTDLSYHPEHHDVIRGLAAELRRWQVQVGDRLADPPVLPTDWDRQDAT